MTSFSLFAAAQDAGAANVLIPVLQELRARGRSQIRLAAAGPAAALFKAQGLELQPAEPLRPLVEESDLLLLGTAWGPSIDKAALRLARSLNIPSVSVIDHWSCYRERFEDPESNGLCLPTRIALMDERTLEQAVAAGLPREILRVTGQPHLDRLAENLRQPEVVRRAQQLRREWLEGARRPVLLFASELFSEDFAPGTPHHRGYDEVDTLEELAQAMEEEDLQAQLVVKLHPKESADSYQPGPRARARGVRVVRSEQAWPCILAADGVVGMTSMLLLESALAGKPTISFQPARGRRAPFIGSEIGLIASARSMAELKVLLRQAMGQANGASGNAPERARLLASLAPGNSAARIADLLEETAE